MHELLTINNAREMLSTLRIPHNTISLGNGRGLIGSLAAIGAKDAFSDWTHEYISYRKQDNWGTPRDVDADSAFETSAEYHPRVWDTVDHANGDVVCVPHTHCPILHGIRGG